MNLLFLEVLL